MREKQNHNQKQIYQKTNWLEDSPEKQKMKKKEAQKQANKSKKTKPGFSSVSDYYVIICLFCFCIVSFFDAGLSFWTFFFVFWLLLA